MPRPRVRRGADAKADDKKAKRERAEAEALAAEASAKRARYKKSEMPHLPTASSSTLPDSEKPVDPDALPEPDIETKAYFREIAENISELEELGQGRGSYKAAVVEGEEEDELAEDDRPLLLRSALESLSGHEIPLAGDGDTSIILERLLYSMDDFARRVLAERFIGSYEKLSKHRAASHVVQTLLTLAGETVDRETRGIIAPEPSNSTSTASLPTMTALLLSALAELLPSLSTQIYDPFSSHTLRILLLIFAGSVPTQEGRLSAERSKKSLKWRKGQGTMKSFLAPDESTAAQEKVEKRKVPKEFSDALVSMWESLNALDEGGAKGDGVRRAAMDEVAGPAVRIMIEMEAEGEGGWQKGGWADRVLVGLVEEVDEEDKNEGVSASKSEERTEKREEYLGGLLRHPAGSPTLEMLLKRASPKVFERIWSGLFRGKLARLGGNQVANFVLAVGITRLEKVAFEETVKEIVKIGAERRGEWIDNSRTGVLRSLLDRSAQLQICEKEMGEVMLDTFQLNRPEDQKLVIPCLLTLNRLEYYKKLPAHLLGQPSTQGSVLLQSWLGLHPPHQQAVIDSIASLGVTGLMPLTRDPTSSRVLDSFLSSTTTPPSALRKFLMSLLGHYHTLADDRIGSRVVERCWAVADVYLKDKIAASLVEQANFLQASQFGHFFARKVEIPLWTRKREDWKLKMANGGVPVGFVKRERPAVPSLVLKRRERPEDEMDEIFAKKVKKGKNDKVVLEAGEEVVVKEKKVLKTEGLEDVFSALKASAQ